MIGALLGLFFVLVALCHAILAERSTWRAAIASACVTIAIQMLLAFFGLVRMFQDVAHVRGEDKATLLSNAISEFLTTLPWGLLVYAVAAGLTIVGEVRRRSRPQPGPRAG